jgi:uncharacterized protein (DUF1684 family)
VVVPGCDDLPVADYLAEWAAWRDLRESRLRSPRGWLAITAIHWLTDAPQRFDDVPGAWVCHDDGVIVTLAGEEVLTSGDRRLTAGVHELGPIDEAGLRVAFGDAVTEVARRGGAVVLRPRHPHSPNLRAYRGTPCYRPDPEWVVLGRFRPYGEPGRPGDPTIDEVAVGEVVFGHGGGVHRLVAWGEDDGSLWIVFRDATSGVTTYPSSRQLLTAPPARDGTVHLDFNRTYNMPCAYTDFATCPLPPAANTLPFAVEAGEQVPAWGGPPRH